ncbi:MAG: DNA double-strand break repair nuclease NurA [Promethearchaeota archaeon]
MPEFVVELQKFLSEKREQILDRLISTLQLDNINNELSSRFNKLWHQLPAQLPIDPSSLIICATDGSYGSRALADGMHLFVARALTISNQQKEIKKVRAGFFSPRGNSRAVAEYISLQSEHAEHQSILELLDAMESDISEERPMVVLLDGSIYGRLQQLFVELAINEDPGFILKYYETYVELLERCIKNPRIHLIGVSKDSGARFVIRELYAELLNEQLNSLSHVLSQDESEFLSRYFIRRPGIKVPRETERRNKKQFQEIISNYDPKLNVLLDFERIRDYMLPDFYFIDKFINRKAGYMEPFLLCLEANRPDLKQLSIEGIERDFHRTFARVQPEDRTIVARKIVNLKQKIKALPPIISSYVVLGDNDSPIRIDFFSRENHENVDREIDGFVKSTVLDQYIGWLEAMYGGIKNYNIFLVQVDRRVKLQNKTLDTIYKDLIEKITGVPLLYSRDARRIPTYHRTG